MEPDFRYQLRRHKIWRVNWRFHTLSAALSYGWTLIKLSTSWCESSESFNSRNGHHWNQITRRTRRSVACCNDIIIYPDRRFFILIGPYVCWWVLIQKTRKNNGKFKMAQKDLNFSYTLSEIIYTSAKIKCSLSYFYNWKQRGFRYWLQK